MMMNKLWIIVPAAGTGTRMAAAIPKQYLPLLDKTILEHTLERLLAIPHQEKILLVLSVDDTHWKTLPLAQDARIQSVQGGARRCDSVLNALNLLTNQAVSNDWVLVHDAARPCVALDNILDLLEKIKSHAVGGILGIPVSDTLKKIDASDSKKEIIDTVDRQSLWRAQTPQVFRFGLLRECLTRALMEGKTINDESSAVEVYGYKPLIIEGREDNIKITRPEDLSMAALLMR
jgi:2-C-methyl-D-erythritol 4-phosphate cytidylyltransferase